MGHKFSCCTSFLNGGRDVDARLAWEQVIMALEAKVETQLFEVALMELKDGLRVDVRVAVGKAG